MSQNQQHPKSEATKSPCGDSLRGRGFFSRILHHVRCLPGYLKPLGRQERVEKGETAMSEPPSSVFTPSVEDEKTIEQDVVVNALLGKEDLVPTSADVATSTQSKIHHSERLIYWVFFRREQERQHLGIKPEEVELYGTEQGNPNNETGVVIFDTPGLGGILHEHRRITYEYLLKAGLDVVLPSMSELAGLNKAVSARRHVPDANAVRMSSCIQ